MQISSVNSMNYGRSQNQTPFGAKITILDGVVQGKNIGVTEIVNVIAEHLGAKGEAVRGQMLKNGQAVIDNAGMPSKIMNDAAEEMKQLGFNIKYEA